MTHEATDVAWVPESCTLPTVEQPLRVAEFDELFSRSLRDVVRRAQSSLRLWLDPDSEQAARELAARETACCAFFTFDVAADSDGLHVDVGVPAAQIPVLDALETRARSSLRH